MRWSFSPTNGTIFLLFTAIITTSCQQNKQSLNKLELPCGRKFLRVLIFAIFPAIQKKSSLKKNYRKHFSRKNLLQSKHTPTKILYTKMQN